MTKQKILPFFESHSSSEFMKYTQFHSKDFPTISNSFLYQKSQKKFKLSKVFLEAYQSKIVIKKERKKPSICYIDVTNCFMMKKQIQYQEKLLYVLKFATKEVYEEFYHPHEEIVDQWIQIFQKYCIQLYFKKSFQIIKILGTGAFAKVFEVKSIKNLQKYAVKVFHKKIFQNQNVQKEAILNEIFILRQIEHPNLLSINQIFEGVDHIYLVMKLCKGVNLLEYLRVYGQFSENGSLKIIQQIFSGLSYLHSQNIMHRDLKLENIIIDEDNQTVNIVDFGFSCRFQDCMTLFSRCGTPGYIAPEILSSDKYNEKVDVYSGGIILYILLTLKNPFFDEKSDDVLFCNKRAKVDFNFQAMGLKLRDSTKNFIMKILQVNPINRLTSHQIINHKIFDFLKSNEKPLKIQQSKYLIKQLSQHSTLQNQQANPYMNQMGNRTNQMMDSLDKESEFDFSELMP